MRSAQIDVGGRSISDGQWSVSDGRRVVVVAAALNASALTDRPTIVRYVRPFCDVSSALERSMRTLTSRSSRPFIAVAVTLYWVYSRLRQHNARVSPNTPLCRLLYTPSRDLWTGIDQTRGEELIKNRMNFVLSPPPVYILPRLF